MRREYKSYTFNCCWLSVDFPGVVGRAGEINHSNEEETSGRGGAAAWRTHRTALCFPHENKLVVVKTPTLHKAVLLQEVTARKVKLRLPVGDGG